MPVLRLPLLATFAATAALLAACGGGSSSSGAAPSPSPTPPAATGLAGQVAVGVPLTDAKVRILDADGNVVAQDIAVGSDGSYTVPTLTGRAPWRVEACGYAGANYLCLYSVAQRVGTAHVTPLTNATVLLASGQTPESLASGAAPGLDGAAVDAAQEQLRSGLAGVMSGNVPAGFDFIGGDLSAGSRSGYDRVLDSVGVDTGVDGSAFVQITPRTGSGNLYLQQGSSSGSVTVDSGSASISLAGLDALFARMSAAIASEGACYANLAAELASNARIDMGGGSLAGPAQVAAGLCGFFAEGRLWGATLMSPTLGRCDASGAAPRCRVGFVLRAPDGGMNDVGNGMGVALEGGTWKFLGSYEPIMFDLSARAQRSRRIDGPTPVDTYERAIAVGIPAVSGLQCAKVTQRNAAGDEVVVAYFKAFGSGAKNLAAWRDANGERSLDPATGQMRSGDDTWLMLPEGSTGDEVVRNFFRGGRTLALSLYADAGCSSAFVVDGRSRFEVDIDGVPPVWASMPTLPWPELDAASVAAVTGLSLAANAGAELPLAWTFATGRAGIDEATFCSDGAACGDGESGRIAHRSLSPAVPSVTLSLANGPTPMGNFRLVALNGSGPDGLRLQANFASCSSRPAGERCY